MAIKLTSFEAAMAAARPVTWHDCEISTGTIKMRPLQNEEVFAIISGFPGMTKLFFGASKLFEQEKAKAAAEAAQPPNRKSRRAAGARIVKAPEPVAVADEPVDFEDLQERIVEALVPHMMYGIAEAIAASMGGMGNVDLIEAIKSWSPQDSHAARDKLMAIQMPEGLESFFDQFFQWLAGTGKQEEAPK